MNKINRIAKAAADCWIIAGVTLVLVLVVELSLQASFVVYDVYTQSDVDYRATADTYGGEIWPRRYYEEFWESYESQWTPYAYYRRVPFKGEFINVDSNCIRRSWVPAELPVQTYPPRKIFMFGGSTVWGTGARDEFSIPSNLAKLLHTERIGASVTNFGESGYVFLLETISLIVELRKGNIPDIVIFYNGINDTLSADQQNVAGIPYNEFNREIEFNLSQPRKTGQLVKMASKNVFAQSSTMRLINRLSFELGIRAKTGAFPKQPGGVHNKRLAQEVVTNYLAAIKLVRALGVRYGFKCLFYWQPTIFEKAYLTAYEKKERDSAVAYQPFFQEVSRCVEKNIDSADDDLDNFQNLSSIFANTREPIFIDWIHIGERGNKLIAEKIAKGVNEAISN